MVVATASLVVAIATASQAASLKVVEASTIITSSSSSTAELNSIELAQLKSHLIES